jgi:hypothetical protein
MMMDKEVQTVELKDHNEVWREIITSPAPPASNIELVSLTAQYDASSDKIGVQYQVIVLEQGTGFRSGVVGIIPPGHSEENPVDFEVTQLLGPVQSTNILSLAGMFASSRWEAAYKGQTLRVLVGGSTVKDGTETPFTPFETTVKIS